MGKTGPKLVEIWPKLMANAYFTSLKPIILMFLRNNVCRLMLQYKFHAYIFVYHIENYLN